MTASRWLTGAVLAVAVASATCDSPTDVTPREGDLVVRLVSPAGDIGALVLTLQGPALPGEAATIAPTGTRLFTRTTGNQLRVAAFGLAGTEVLRFRVEDVNRAKEYSATVVEIAAPDFTLRDPSAYRLTITAD